MSGPERVSRVGNVSGVRTELLVTRFTDKLLLTISQLNKFGTWLQLDRAAVRPDGQDTGSVTSHVYTCTVLLGQDTEEVQFLGRTLAEKLGTDKTVILTVGVKSLTVPLALELVKFTRFGQLVIGPPGSGKTTYVAAMSELLTSLGRKVAIVNLDPGNENMTYKPDVDVSELVTVEDVMDEMKLGPNGGLMHAMQFVRTNLDWLDSKLGSVDLGSYLILDCPGQVELYTVDSNMKDIIDHLSRRDVRLTCVNLVDSHHCSDAGKFVSICLTSLTSMLQIALPHVNLLSKVDLVEKYGKLHFSLDYYTDVLDLEYLIDTFPEDNFTKKYKLLNEALTGLISDYSLVNFVPVTVKSKERLLAASQVIDKANGYVFGSGEERSMRNLMGLAHGADFEWSKTGDVRTEYMEDGDEEDRNTDSKVKFGNDLDLVDIDPQFQV